MKNIVIVGSNATGWTTALFLAKNLQDLNVKVSLVDCQKVEECKASSSVPSSNVLYQSLGIDLKELMIATHATFNLGAHYNDWNDLNDAFVVPYRQQGFTKGIFDFQQLFIKSQQLGNISNLNEYSLAAMTAKLGKFAFPNFENNSILSTLAFGLNFDNEKYSDFLESKAKSCGVKKYTVNINGVSQNNKGSIEKLLGNNDFDIHGDFFIDCSGEQRLLIGQLANDEFEEVITNNAYDKMLFATFDNKNEIKNACVEFMPHSFGYIRTTPLQGRKEVVYAYSSQFLNDDEAKKELLSHGGKLIGAVSKKNINSVNRERFWINNCLALGESAANIEPLEIGNIQFLQNALDRFMKLYPNKNDFTNAEQYNRLTVAEYALVSDYHKLPFVLNKRSDSEFWKSCRTLLISNSLQHAIELFKSYGRQPVYDESLIEKHRWVSAFIGFGIKSSNYHPLVDMLDESEMSNQLLQIKTQVTQAVNSLPNHDAFIQRFCLSSYN